MTALAIAATSLVALQSPAQAGPNATGHVDIREILSGSRETFVVTVTNTSSDTPIGWVEINPSTDKLTVTDAAAEGWSPIIDPSSGKTVTTFTGGPIPLGESRDFYLLVDAAQQGNNDSTSSWDVKVRQSATSAGDGVSNDQPDGWKTSIRVLSVDYLDVTSPEGALDYTVTQGQSVTLEATISNYGTQQVGSVDPQLVMGSNESSSVTPNSSDIPAGGSVTYTFTYTPGSPGTRTLEAYEDKDCCKAIRAVSDELTIQPSPSFTYTSGSLSPLASVSQAVQTFSVSVAKNDSPAVYLDPALTRLTFRDNGADVFSTNLAGATTIDEGASEAGLTFAPLTIPNVANKAYAVRLTLAGEDDNGKLFSQVIDTTASFVKEDGMPYAKPQIAAPQGQVDPDGMPVVKDGDTITLSGDIKTSSAPNAPVDPTAQILDCDLAVLDADLARVGSIDVPLTQCQNAGGHFSGQIAPASIGVTEGFMRLEAQVKKAVGGVTSPPDQVSNLIVVDNQSPRILGAIGGCGLAGQVPCDNARAVRVKFTEPVKGPLLPSMFVVTENVVLTASYNCDTTTPCDEAILGLTIPYQEQLRDLEHVSGLVAPVKDLVGHPLAPQEIQLLDCPSYADNVSQFGDETSHCTHGGDPPHAGDGSECLDPGDQGNDRSWTSCVDDSRVRLRNPCKLVPGKSGDRIRVFYGYPAGTTPHFGSRAKATIREKLRYADAYLDESSAPTEDQSRIPKDQHFRFYCQRDQTSSGTVRHRIHLTSVKILVSPKDEEDDDPMHLTFGEIKSAMDDAGYNAEEHDDIANGNGRIFVVFLDNVSGRNSTPSYSNCGDGELSTWREPSNPRRKDRGGRLALIRCWGGEYPLHEIFHTLGAVQREAPHGTTCESDPTTGYCRPNSSYAHCWDESSDDNEYIGSADADVMCYDDYSEGVPGQVLNRNNIPTTMENLCEDDLGRGDGVPVFWQLDCGYWDETSHDHLDGTHPSGEDYWDPENPVGWLAQNWNTARSVFLTPPINDDEDPYWKSGGF